MSSDFFDSARSLESLWDFPDEEQIPIGKQRHGFKIAIVSIFFGLILLGAVVFLMSERTTLRYESKQNLSRVEELEKKELELANSVAELNEIRVALDKEIDAVNTQNKRLTRSVTSLENELDAVYAQTQEGAFVSFVSLGTTRPAKCKFVLMNITFPVSVSVNRKTELVFEDKEIDVEVNDLLEFQILPGSANGWLPPFTILELDGSRVIKMYGSTLGRAKIQVEDGTVIGCQMEQVSPPWNAKLVDFNGHKCLVSLMSPWASHRPKNYDPASGKLPNTIAHWATLGDQRMSQELAAHFISMRNKDSNGMYRVNDISINVPMTNNRRPREPFLSADKDQLASLISLALKNLRDREIFNKPGTTVADEIEEWKKNN